MSDCFRNFVSKGLLFYCSILYMLCGYNGVQSVEYLTEKPSFLPSCKIYEKGFTKCSTNSISKLMEQLNIGIPELSDVIETLDPMKVDQIIFKQDNSEVATIRANLTDLLVRGFSKIHVNESRVSKKDFSWNTKLFYPNFRVDGKYKMAGKILLIPLNGAGNMFIELENVNIHMRTKTRLYEKGGFTFYNVTQVRVNLDITGCKCNFDNIFNGNNKEVERSTNQFFNDNWRDFFDALRPVLYQTIETVLLDLLQKVFNAIPANFFVEDIPTSEQLYGKETQ